MNKIVTKTVTEYEYDTAGRISKETIVTENYEIKEGKTKIGYSNSVCDERP